MMQDAVSMDFRRWKLGNIPEQWEGNPPGMTQDAVFVDFRRRRLGNMLERREGNPLGKPQKAVSVDFRRWNSRIYQNSGREIHLE